MPKGRGAPLRSNARGGARALEAQWIAEDEAKAKDEAEAGEPQP